MLDDDDPPRLSAEGGAEGVRLGLQAMLKAYGESMTIADLGA